MKERIIMLHVMRQIWRNPHLEQRNKQVLFLRTYSSLKVEIQAKVHSKKTVNFMYTYVSLQSGQKCQSFCQLSSQELKINSNVTTEVTQVALFRDA